MRPERLKAMNRKTQGIIAAAVKLGAAESADFSGGGVVQTLKELAVATGAAESVDDISAKNISGVLGYIAENGEDIVYPEPTGTKSITENGTVDVKDYASAEVAVPAAAVVSGTLSITENGTFDVTEKANVEVNVSANLQPQVKLKVYGTNPQSYPQTIKCFPSYEVNEGHLLRMFPTITIPANSEAELLGEYLIPLRYNQDYPSYPYSVNEFIQHGKSVAISVMNNTASMTVIKAQAGSSVGTIQIIQSWQTLNDIADIEILATMVNT